jgi:predicted  nucleic acid-binding Zn-ribbon protein
MFSERHSELQRLKSEESRLKHELDQANEDFKKITERLTALRKDYREARESRLELEKSIWYEEGKVKKSRSQDREARGEKSSRSEDEKLLSKLQRQIQHASEEEKSQLLALLDGSDPADVQK